MASKIREVTLTQDSGRFSVFKNKKEEFDQETIASFRSLFSNEKARILYVIKTEKPKSIYDLAKKLGRPFKAVFDDIKVLERFGFIELIREKTKKRDRLRPVIGVSTMTFHFRV